MPSFEKTSASSPSSTLPLMTWTRGTPNRQAATAWRALEACAGATRPLSNALASSSTDICRAMAPLTTRPSDVVMYTSFTASSALATSSATASELTR